MGDAQRSSESNGMGHRKGSLQAMRMTCQPVPLVVLGFCSSQDTGQQVIEEVLRSRDKLAETKKLFIPVLALLDQTGSICPAKPFPKAIAYQSGLSDGALRAAVDQTRSHGGWPQGTGATILSKCLENSCHRGTLVLDMDSPETCDESQLGPLVSRAAYMGCSLVVTAARSASYLSKCKRAFGPSRLLVCQNKNGADVVQEIVKWFVQFKTAREEEEEQQALRQAGNGTFAADPFEEDDQKQPPAPDEPEGEETATVAVLSGEQHSALQQLPKAPPLPPAVEVPPPPNGTAAPSPPRPPANTLSSSMAFAATNPEQAVARLRRGDTAMLGALSNNLAMAVSTISAKGQMVAEGKGTITKAEGKEMLKYPKRVINAGGIETFIDTADVATERRDFHLWVMALNALYNACAIALDPRGTAWRKRALQGGLHQLVLGSLACEQDTVQQAGQMIENVFSAHNMWPESKCAKCGMVEDEDVSLKSCARCKCVMYCSAACQLSHFLDPDTGHQKECVAWAEKYCVPRCVPPSAP